MPRGGSRQGTPGRSYANRTDLQKPKLPAVAATGQQYGMHKQQVDAQRAQPMGASPSPAPLNSAPTGGGQPLPATPLPGQVTPLNAPSERPDEQVTAGLPVGAGPGPEALGGLAPVGGVDVAGQLRAIYARFPNDDIRAVLEQLDQG